MKHRITFLMLLAMVVISSCSSDDDGKNTVPMENLRETLVGGSPWVFNKLDVLHVTYNWSNLSEAEILDLYKSYLTETSYIFVEDGTGFYTDSEGDRYDINWDFGKKNDGSIDYSVITLDNRDYGRFEDISITNNSFSFKLYEYCVGFEFYSEDVCADVRIMFKSQN